MEANATLCYVYPPGPTTSRGQNISLSANPEKTKIVYCTSNLVVIRHIKDPKNIELFSLHVNDTSCAKYSPKGDIIASGDSKGTLKLWYAEQKDHNQRKEYECYLGGKIRDIAWTADGQRICIVGESSGIYARVFLSDTGSMIGEISGNAKNLLSCAFSPSRPLRLIVGGEENVVNIYEGPPFKFKKSTKVHSNFVNCVRYNPKGDIFVSVSSDKKIVVHDSQTLDEKTTITDKSHEGTISYCDFIDDDKLITCSFDKTIRIWDLKTNTCSKILSVTDTPQIADMQVAVAGLKEHICSFSLDATLNIWHDYDSLESKSKPTASYPGHQNSIIGVEYSYLLDLLVTADICGKILLWKNHLSSNPIGNGHTKNLNGINLSSDEKLIYSYDVTNTIKILDLTKQEYIKSTEIKANIKALAISRVDATKCYIATDKKKIMILNDLEVIKEFEVESEPTCLDVSNKDEILFFGDKNGLIYAVDAQSGTLIKKLTHTSNGKITTIKVSRNTDEYLVSGDSTKKIILWELKEFKVLTEDWVYHNASISSLQFSNNNRYVISSSLDNKIIIWNTNDHSKVVELHNVHKKGAFCATFMGLNGFITGGGDNLIKEYSSPVLVNI